MNSGLDEEELESVRASNRVHKALVNYIDERYCAMLYDLRMERTNKV